MFYRHKMIGGKKRWYLVESYRDEKTGKPKHRTIAYLGSSKTVLDRLYRVRWISDTAKLIAILESGECPGVSTLPRNVYKCFGFFNDPDFQALLIRERNQLASRQRR